MKEAQLHQALMAWLDKHRVPYRHDRTDKRTVTTVGEPDFLITYMSRCLYIECKVGKNKLSPEQEKRIAYLRGAGNKVVVAYSLEECIDACHNILCVKDCPRGFDADFTANFAAMKDAVAKVQPPANGNQPHLFIGAFGGRDYVFHGTGIPGSTTDMIRPATAQDLMELPRT